MSAMPWLTPRLLVELMWFRAYADLKAERARTYLGFAWWFLEPILFMLVFYVLFDVLMKRGGEHFVEFLLIGLVVWQWFRAGVTQCGSSIAQSATLFRQLRIPLFVFPGSRLITASIKFLLVYVVLIGYVHALGHRASAAYLFIPVLLVCQVLLIAGLGTLLSSVMPFVPDLKSAIEPLLTAVFFLSGVFWSVESLGPAERSLALLNPMAVMIASHRQVLLDGRIPDFGYLLYVASIGAATLSLGIWVLVRWRGRYPKLPA